MIDKGMSRNSDLVCSVTKRSGATDETRSLLRHCRNLVAQGFTAACRHDHERVATLQRGLDYRLLLSAKLGIPEDIFQDFLWGKVHESRIRACYCSWPQFTYYSTHEDRRTVYLTA